MITIEKIIEKMCHAPAQCFNISDRGFLREGYFADIAIVDADEVWKVEKSNIYYKCGWSPFEGETIRGRVKQTFVSGHLAYNSGSFDESRMGKRVEFQQT